MILGELRSVERTQGMLGIRASVIGCAMGIGLSSAAAEPMTRYIHYPVSGSSLSELYAAMLQNGPYVGQVKAFASIKMEPKIVSKTRPAGRSCRVESFRFQMAFTIRLPQLVDPDKVEPESRARFNDFYRFAKRHEETHRNIWIGCAEEAEVLVTDTVANSCSLVEAKGIKLVEGVAKDCDARHVAFDNSEKRLLANHPFMQSLRVARLRNLSTAGKSAEKAFAPIEASLGSRSK